MMASAKNRDISIFSIHDAYSTNAHGLNITRLTFRHMREKGDYYFHSIERPLSLHKLLHIIISYGNNL